MSVGDEGYLADTNVLLRSAQSNAPQHATAVAAITALRQQGVVLYLTPQNIIEFWGVATRPTDVNGLGMTPAEADAELRRLEGFFAILPDVPEIYTEWRQIALSVGVSGRQVHDARLVAVMRAHGITRILTFNPTDFVRYPGITVVHPGDVLTPPPVGETDGE
jgi:predicted nucleic acid-binding protein